MAVEYGALFERLADAGASFVVNLVEGVIAALIVMVILAVGYVVARALVYVLKKALAYIKLEKLLASHGVHDALFGFTVTSLLSVFLGLLVMFMFLGIAADVVNIDTLKTVSAWLLWYLPQLFQGLAILAIAMMAADYITDNLSRAKHVPFLNGIGVVLKVFIAYVALVMSFESIFPNVSVDLLKRAFEAVLYAVVLAVGFGGAIALGLGFKDAVAEIAKKKKSKFEHWL